MYTLSTKGDNMKISEKVLEAINVQIKNEFDNAFLYLSIASWCEEHNLCGFAKWNLKQFEEEQEHGMKFYRYVFERQGRVEVKEIEKPRQDWENIAAVYEDILKREEQTTRNIYDLYNIAEKENDRATMSLLKWYIDEQVEEESNASAMLAKIKMAGDSQSALMFVDSEAGKRE